MKMDGKISLLFLFVYFFNGNETRFGKATIEKGTYESGQGQVRMENLKIKLQLCNESHTIQYAYEPGVAFTYPIVGRRRSEYIVLHDTHDTCRSGAHSIHGQTDGHLRRQRAVGLGHHDDPPLHKEMDDSATPSLSSTRTPSTASSVTSLRASSPHRTSRPYTPTVPPSGCARRHRVGGQAALVVAWNLVVVTMHARSSSSASSCRCAYIWPTTNSGMETTDTEQRLAGMVI
jgi:hypothetical protein